jgi:hypothetical protein
MELCMARRKEIVFLPALQDAGNRIAFPSEIELFPRQNKHMQKYLFCV